MVRAISRTVVLVAALLAGGCGGGCCDAPLDDTAGPPSDMAPDFLLEDVNDTSSTYARKVSPRLYVGEVSAWYFGQAG